MYAGEISNGFLSLVNFFKLHWNYRTCRVIYVFVFNFQTHDTNCRIVDKMNVHRKNAPSLSLILPL
jgi:hypothetical protein